MKLYHGWLIFLVLLAVQVAVDAFRARSYLNRVTPSRQHRKLVRYSQMYNRLAPDDMQDLNVAQSQGSDNSYASDLKRTVGTVAAAGAFAALIAVFKGIPSAIDFCSGYLLEQSLSVDNLFVILLIFEYFKIERKDQDRALQYGIVGALILRAVFIILGSAMLNRFHQIVLLFAGILLYSSYQVLFKNKDATKEDIAENGLIRLATKFFKTSPTLDGQKFFTIVDGVKMATPYLLCTICIELSDMLFAVDSVPAIFGITKDPFIVYTSNIFAIMGLRSLFGVLSQAMHDLEYLEKAVGVILGIIALKMGCESVGWELLNPLQSLVLVTSVLGTGIAASLLKLQMKRLEVQ